MSLITKSAFLEDAYLTACEGSVIGFTDDGGIILDQTNFYATSGGQPGDSGHLEREDGSQIQIATAIYGDTRKEIALQPTDAQPVPNLGERLIGHIDWERRYQLMKLHTACHLLSVVCPYPITGAAISDEGARIDFDLSEASVTKEDVTQKLMTLVEENHPVFIRWITEAELDEDPSIVRSKNVRPPRGLGDVRLVCIGDDAIVDSQPCGGTHVSETAEIGDIHIAKIEKKGKENRRFRIKFGKTAE